MATVDWDGERIAARIEDAAEQALSTAAEALLDASNRKAPIETGALIRSGTVVAEGKEAAVGYTSVYAARQHEEVGWAHDSGRQAKFLETALEAEGPRLEQLIAGQIRNAIGG